MSLPSIKCMQQHIYTTAMLQAVSGWKVTTAAFWSCNHRTITRTLVCVVLSGKPKYDMVTQTFIKTHIVLLQEYQWIAMRFCLLMLVTQMTPLTNIALKGAAVGERKSWFSLNQKVPAPTGTCCVSTELQIALGDIVSSMWMGLVHSGGLWH